MKTRFNVELYLREAERLRLFQLFEYLAEFDGGTALMAQDLPDLVGPDAGGDIIEELFAKQIRVEALGFEIVTVADGAVRMCDIDGVPDLRMLCQIIANAAPRLLPLEFSFALVDEAEHCFSCGLVVMTTSSAGSRPSTQCSPGAAGYCCIERGGGGGVSTHQERMMPMTYDLDFRYRRALQPEGLSTVLTAIKAVEDAIQDARNAGLDPERDPAVTLLARHVGRLASPCAIDDATGDQPLRAACLERIADLRSRPAIVALVRRGVDYDPEGKRAFRREAGRALRQIANELGLSSNQYAIHHDRDHFGAAGDVTLASGALHIRITPTRVKAGREISYRTARNRHDELGGPLHHADIGRLSNLERFARQIAAELKIMAPCGQGRFL